MFIALYFPAPPHPFRWKCAVRAWYGIDVQALLHLRKNICRTCLLQIEGAHHMSMNASLVPLLCFPPDGALFSSKYDTM